MPAARARARRSPAAGCLAAILALAGPAAADTEIFVPNSSGDSVTVYAITAAGDAAPVRSLGGPTTGIDNDFGVAADAEHRELYVSNISLDTVTVYLLDAEGDQAPLRTLAGPATQLALPIGLFVDPFHDELYVRNAGSQTVLVFARTAEGDAAPIRVLASTAIFPNAVDLFVDLAHDELVVANRNFPDPSTILVFARTAEGNAAPLREIAGPAAGLTGDGAYAVAVDSFHDEILVTRHDSIRVFARTAAGDVAPLRAIEGAATLLSPGATGIDVDLGRGEILVSVADSDAILVFSRTANGNVAPLRSIVGAATGLDLPRLLALPGPVLFGDGFESGDTGGWSTTAR